MRNSDEIFRKNVTYDNIKSDKRQELHTFSEKPQGGQIDAPAILGLKSVKAIHILHLQYYMIYFKKYFNNKIFTFSVTHLICISYKLFVSSSSFLISHFDEASFLGQYGIFTKTTFFWISNKLWGIMKSTISLDFWLNFSITLLMNLSGWSALRNLYLHLIYILMFTCMICDSINILVKILIGIPLKVHKNLPV